MSKRLDSSGQLRYNLRHNASGTLVFFSQTPSKYVGLSKIVFVKAVSIPK